MAAVAEQPGQGISTAVQAWANFRFNHSLHSVLIAAITKVDKSAL